MRLKKNFMRPDFLWIMLIFSYFPSSAQVRAVVIDANTKEKIPYVNIWIENENTGTTSNEAGEFELILADTNKMILFSAIGYTTKTIKAGNISGLVALMPQSMLLQEVFIHSKKGTKTLKIGRFNKSEIRNYFGSSVSPWMVANYYEYQDGYKNTPFLKKLNILTESTIKKATFNIRLYSVSESGKPGDYLYDKNIIGTARRGKNMTEVDLSDLNIQFPENGFFIAFEWLIIESNKYTVSYTRSGSKERYDGIKYSPSIGSIIGTEESNCWRYTEGAWSKFYRPVLAKSGRYSLAAIELTLTN